MHTRTIPFVFEIQHLLLAQLATKRVDRATTRLIDAGGAVRTGRPAPYVLQSSLAL